MVMTELIPAHPAMAPGDGQAPLCGAGNEYSSVGPIYRLVCLGRQEMRWLAGEGGQPRGYRTKCTDLNDDIKGCRLPC